MTITIDAGRSAELSFTCTDNAGEIVDITGGTFLFYAYPSPTDLETPTLTLDGVVTDGEAGLAAVQVTPADTEEMPYSVLWYEAMLALGSDEWRVDSGKLIVQA